MKKPVIIGLLYLLAASAVGFAETQQGDRRSAHGTCR